MPCGEILARASRLSAELTRWATPQLLTLAAHRVKFFRTAHHRVAQVYLRFEKHAVEDPLLTLDRFRRAVLSRRDGFPVVRLRSALRRAPFGLCRRGFFRFLFLLRLKEELFVQGGAPGAALLFRASQQRGKLVCG